MAIEAPISGYKESQTCHFLRENFPSGQNSAPGLWIYCTRYLVVAVRHLFDGYKIDPSCEILIIGTFNPASDHNTAKIFYGRSKNYLWSLLPAVFGEANLKQARVEEKREFMKRRRVDFIDLIAEIDVDRVKNYSDRFIACAITEPWDIALQIECLPMLKHAFFTRKRFSDVPPIRRLAERAAAELIARGVTVGYLPTPARFVNEAKRREWNETFARAGLVLG